ncbi:hypothetical protein Dsin_014221 [Dipteronia sinensis]|uniref:Gelsolin-like domain-containing protein n=1 Tax=Dipteronia sinensis TaxID=43782 RepID=A0AAE0E9Q8_9ROSI|nr:hypothetical protein Dsin_014221 [Dipteronia sinensis]
MFWIPYNLRGPGTCEEAAGTDKGNLKVTEMYNFSQDDLMTEDIFMLDCHSKIFVWVGEQVDSKNKMLALTIGEIGNSFQRKLAILKKGGTPIKHMTYLEYVPQEVLYTRLCESGKSPIGINIGDTSIGICIGDIKQSNAKPILPLGGGEGYTLSYLEKSLNEKSNGGEVYDYGWFKPYNVFSPQVLEPSSMTASEMSHILNDLEEANSVYCFLFGYSADRRHTSDKDNVLFSIPRHGTDKAVRRLGQLCNCEIVVL